MKKLIIMAVCLLTLFSCGKKNGNTTTPSTSSPNKSLNSISLNTNGKTYTVIGTLKAYNPDENVVWVTNSKDGTNNEIRIIVQRNVLGNTIPDFELEFRTIPNSNTIGKFILEGGFLIENFSNGQSYDDVQGYLELTNNDNSLISGDYNITVKNNNNTKQIAGKFNATSF